MSEDPQRPDGPRVLFYVQHLLGIGHQRRGATITRGLQKAGCQVTYVSGGHEIPNLNLGGAELVQLPPVRAVDLFFKKLVDEFDQPIDDAWREKRKNALLDCFQRVNPDVIIIELFPFGRRQMRFELLALLDAAKAMAKPPVILSSVRDILVEPPKPERLSEMLQRIEQYFDHVLVHGDPALIPFDRTFAHAHAIADKLHYTGYVVDTTGSDKAADGRGRDEILVSAGGGAVGEKLLRAAMQARALTTQSAATWRVLVGISVPEEDFLSLKAAAEPGIIVERARGDFPALLMNCAGSISQGGYNTIMEGLHAKAPMVVVPYAGGLETEQTLRAELLAERNLVQVVSEEHLAPESLAIALESALMANPKRDRQPLNTDGEATTARLVLQWAEERKQKTGME